jgi:hypothetical protein
MPYSYIVSRILDAYPSLDANVVHGQLTEGSYASLEDRFIYIEVYKAASTTMRMLLRELYGSPSRKLAPGFHGDTFGSIYARASVPLPSLTALSDSDQRELIESPDVLRFTIVRNPYTRLVSAWRNKVFLCDPWIEDVYTAVRGEAPPIDQAVPVTFAEFVWHIENAVGRVWDAHWQKQVDLTLPKALSFSHIGKLESFPETIQVFLQRVKHDGQLKVPNVNEVPIKLAPKFSAELAARVYTIYEEDFITFGYDRDSWPREQEDRPSSVSQECFLDYVISRNRIIRELYRERDRLREERDYLRQMHYRFSLARIQNKVWRLLGGRKSK